MLSIEMPQGFYISLSGMIRPGTGGQTRALIMRNRLFTQHAGIDTHLVTFDAEPSYDQTRAVLRERGELVEGMQLLNIFEWYRERPLPSLEPLDVTLPVLEGYETIDVTHPDGSIYYTAYVLGEQPTNAAGEATGDEVAHDYRRPDGSVYLRVPVGTRQAVTPYVLVDPAGNAVARWPRKGGWHRFWLRELAGDAERVFVISDSRFALAHVLPMRDRRFHLMHLMHNAHTVGERRWNSTLSGAYGPLLASIRHLDGLVTLTDRQRRDVVQRYGETDNLFVVPNPVVLPTLPDPMPPRDHATFAVVSRLESQKRLDHAVRIFAKVLKARPEAKLSIFGKGSHRTLLEKLIADLGVGDSVILRGHDPRAREELLTATGFLMTSTHEGYPLASLESMAFGCPVISYDIKYGPREQVSDSVDGFIVAPGDQQAMADRIISLIDDPERVAQFSAAALVKAEGHDYRAFLRDWKHVLDTVVTQKAKRVDVSEAALDVGRLGYMPLGLPARARFLRTGSAEFARPRRLKLLGSLMIKGRWPDHALDDLSVTLDAVSDSSEAIASLPVEVRKPKIIKVDDPKAGSGRPVRRASVALVAEFDLGQAFAEVSTADRVLRLRLTAALHNWSWSTVVERPAALAPAFELSYGPTGSLSLQRSP